MDFVKQGLKGYGIADFITDEAVAKSIELSNGQPNYVAAPVNIMFNGKNLIIKQLIIKFNLCTSKSFSYYIKYANNYG